MSAVNWDLGTRVRCQLRIGVRSLHAVRTGQAGLLAHRVSSVQAGQGLSDSLTANKGSAVSVSDLSAFLYELIPVLRPLRLAHSSMASLSEVRFV